jgi:hypothetical protein
MAQCTATSKQSGKRCKRTATPGKKTCASHGSKSLAGVDSPTFRSGRYSKDLPQRLLSRYEESLTDPQLLSSLEDIALIDARKGELLARVDSGESGRLWEDLRAAAKVVRAAERKKGGAADFKAAVIELLELIDRGVDDLAAWNDIIRLIEKRERVVTSERRRLVEAQQSLPVREAIAFAGALLDSVVRNVDDARALAAIRADFARIIGDDGARSPGTDPDA